MDEALERIVAAIPRLVSITGIDMAIMGGIARGVWARRRMTSDVDVLAAGADLRAVVAAAAAVGMMTQPDEVRALLRAEMTRLRLPEFPHGEVRLDVVAAVHPFHIRVVGRAVHAEIMGTTVKVARAEDIIVLKVLADRPQDRADVAEIINAQGAKLDVELMRREAADLELELPPDLR